MEFPSIDLKAAVNGLEDAIITLSGPALAISGILAGVDLVTGGHVMQTVPLISLAWAICLLISLDFQVLNLAARAHRVYLSKKSPWRKGFEIGLAVGIASAISYVSVQMQSIIAQVNSAGVSITTAALQLGISPVWLIWERSALVLVLIFLSGWLREDEGSNEQQNEQQSSTVQSLPPPQVQPVQPDLNGLFERLEAMYAQRIEALVERTVERVTISIEQQQQLQAPAPALTLVTSPDVLEMSVEQVNGSLVQGEVQSEPDEGSIGSKVQAFIEQQRQLGIEPTISVIMDVTGCSKGTASRYKNGK